MIGLPSCDHSQSVFWKWSQLIPLKNGTCTMLDFNRFEVLTFDCYGTLVNWEAGLLPPLHRILAAHGKKIDDATFVMPAGYKAADLAKETKTASLP